MNLVYILEIKDGEEWYIEAVFQKHEEALRYKSEEFSEEVDFNVYTFEVLN